MENARLNYIAINSWDELISEFERIKWVIRSNFHTLDAGKKSKVM